MQKISIIIIGGGFGGVAVLRKLRSCKIDAEVTLIDKKKSFDFLPELPGVVGRRIKARHLMCDLKELSRGLGAKFVQAEVNAVDLDKREVSAGSENFSYDYLVIASGSETNFYGQEEIKKYAYKLDSVEDAQRLNSTVKSRGLDNFIISGGGYTGIEVATNLWKHCHDNKLNKNIVIVERAPALLGPLPQNLKSYTVSNIEKLGINVTLNTTISKAEESKVYLSNGQVFDKAMLIWAAGVKTGDFIWKLNAAKSHQGRLKVDPYLRINERCFVVGDAAEFTHKEKVLRMAVQFSIFQGKAAAENIVRVIKGRPLKKYIPIDMGYVVPMANNKSCGLIMGVFVTGTLATFLHYTMCFYRSCSLKNGFGLIKDVIFN